MSKQKDAELVLKLYELRRDEELRKARQWYIGQFNPQSGQDLVGGLLSGPKASAYYRMVVLLGHVRGDRAERRHRRADVPRHQRRDDHGLRQDPALPRGSPPAAQPARNTSKALETVAHRFPNADEAFESRRRLAGIWLKAAENEAQKAQYVQ